MSLRLAVLISGGGRTLLNLLDAIAAGRLDARVELVISSRPDAPGVERARAAGLRVECVAPSELAERLRRLSPDLVILAGYLRRVPVPPFLVGRILNIHPALLPRYGGQGMHGEAVHRAVIAAGDPESGCTVHVVDEQYDHGPIVAQARVPVLPGDTPQTLAARVFEAECRTYPEAIARYAANLR